jgi:ribonuclease III
LASYALNPDVTDFAEIEEKIGYRFGDHADLERALTHASLNRRSRGDSHYQRLEFLGDRVLGLAIADMLHHAFPDANEGELSLRLNALVKGETLAEIADELDLQRFIRTGGDIKSLNGKRMRSVRADVLEALIASIYLDGGLDAALGFVNRFWGRRLNREGAARRDSKTELQEWAHANRLGAPLYREVKRRGPDHEPLFTISVQVGVRQSYIGKGRSKRSAEQAAAQAMLIGEGVWANSVGDDEWKV